MSFQPPKRSSLDDESIHAVIECLNYYRELGEDLPYCGSFQIRYESKLADFFYGLGGNAVAVSSGTAACFIAFQIFKMRFPSGVLAISPIADSGLINSLLILDIPFLILDSDPDSYSVSIESLLKARREYSNLSGMFLVHAGGYVNRSSFAIAQFCTENNIFLIEDISQAIGGFVCDGVRAGTLGDMAVCSTMYRKNLISGSQGGFIITKFIELTKQCRSLADRGKNPEGPLLSRTPGSNLYVGLNWNTDELSCALGVVSLRRLDLTNKLRRLAVSQLIIDLPELSNMGNFSLYEPGDAPFLILFVAKNLMLKREAMLLLTAAGYPFNGYYDFLPEKWPWLEGKYLAFPNGKSRESADTNNRSISIYINERYPH